MTVVTRQDAAQAKQDQAESDQRAPIVIDLGKKDRKQVRKLRKGKPGRLMKRIEESMEHLRENGAMAEDTQAVVIVIRERQKRRKVRAARLLGLR